MRHCFGKAETDRASRYLQQLCKHFAHKVTVRYDPESGRVAFPPGPCWMTATDGTLCVVCESETEEGLATMRGILDRHLERFAWREALVLDWNAGLPDDLPASLRREMATS